MLPLSELAARGYRCKWGPPNKFHGTARTDYRIIVSQRMDKYDALGDWRRLKAGHRLVYEIDDDVFNVTRENWMAYGIYSRPEVQEAVAAAAMIADVTTVTTPVLADVMSAYSRDVRVIPNVVPDELLTMARPPRRDRVVVGWAGGASHGADLNMIGTAVRHVMARHRAAAELHLIGSDFRDTFGVPGARFTDWIPSAADLAYYRGIDFDIGLAPLTGTVFDRSKSAIKAIEYAALGIPVLASDVEPYRDFVQDGKTGYLIRRRGDWAKRLAELVNDDAAREEMGAAARSAAAGHTISTGWRLWADVFEELS